MGLKCSLTHTDKTDLGLDRVTSKGDIGYLVSKLLVPMGKLLVGYGQDIAELALRGWCELCEALAVRTGFTGRESAAVTVESFNHGLLLVSGVSVCSYGLKNV